MTNRLKGQLELRRQLDHDFDAKYHRSQRTVRAYDEAYESAVKLMRSEDLEAFDLSARGLLESTLVVVATEFGRSPEINQDAGRNHFPKAFSALMASGGVKGGQVYGATDKTASNVTENELGAADFNASIAFAMGLPHDLPVMSPSKRPFKMGGESGKPAIKLFG